MAFQHVQAGGGFQIVHNGRAFARPNGKLLRVHVEIYRGEPRDRAVIRIRITTGEKFHLRFDDMS